MTPKLFSVVQPIGGGQSGATLRGRRSKAVSRGEKRVGVYCAHESKSEYIRVGAGETLTFGNNEVDGHEDQIIFPQSQPLMEGSVHPIPHGQRGDRRSRSQVISRSPRWTDG